MSEITTSGIIRTAMAEAIAKASKGELPTNDGKNLTSLCNAITKSIATEMKYCEMQIKLGKDVPLIGNMNIGTSND